MLIQISYKHIYNRTNDNWNYGLNFLFKISLLKSTIIFSACRIFSGFHIWYYMTPVIGYLHSVLCMSRNMSSKIRHLSFTVALQDKLVIVLLKLRQYILFCNIMSKNMKLLSEAIINVILISIVFIFGMHVRVAAIHGHHRAWWWSPYVHQVMLCYDVNTTDCS